MTVAMRNWWPILICAGCFHILPGRGGGKIKAPSSRPIDAYDIALTAGYQIEPVAAGLTYPTGVTWDDAGRLYVVESGYSYGEDFARPRLLRIDPDGSSVAV